MQQISSRQAINNARQRARDVSEDRRMHLGHGTEQTLPGPQAGT